MWVAMSSTASYATQTDEVDGIERTLVNPTAAFSGRGSAGNPAMRCAQGITMDGATDNITGATISSNCKPGFVEFRSACYGKTSDPMEWTMALAYCQGCFGGDLASVADKDENQFLANTLLGSDTVFLGGNDIFSEGDWEWTDGTKWGFTNWKKGEPNNDGGGEHCLEMRPYEKGYWKKGDWNDGKDISAKKAICRYIPGSDSDFFDSDSDDSESDGCFLDDSEFVENKLIKKKDCGCMGPKGKSKVVKNVASPSQCAIIVGHIDNDDAVFFTYKIKGGSCYAKTSGKMSNKKGYVSGPALKIF